jgi:hypothetical protein
MNPVPDDPRSLYVLDPLWQAIKSIDWQNFGIYPIIGLAVILGFALFFYWLRTCTDSS